MSLAKVSFLLTLLATFLIGCTATIPSPGNKNEIIIKRDRYGVPHIYANDTYGLFYGYGYAVAQDRLFQMEMTKRTVIGTAAEVLGKDYLDIDKEVRQGFDPKSIKRQIAALSSEHKAVLEGYAAGYNRWLEEVNKAPEKLMPREFLDYNFKPAAMTPYDIAMIFAGSMAHRFADFNEELNNLAFYQSLVKQHGKEKAWQIFNTLQPLYDADSPTTVPETETRYGESENPQSPPDYLSNASVKAPVRLALDASGKHLPFDNLAQRNNYLNTQYALSGNSGMAGFPSTSNVWLTHSGKTQDAKGVLVNGPQFGWMNPSYVYAVGLHGPDWEVVGNTMLAYPALLFAHNNQIGWGSTAGFGDLVDIFELRLNPDNAEQYLYNESYRDFDKRKETIAVKGEKPLTVTFRHSVYGPVISYDPANGIAYSKKRSWEGLELQTMMAWVDLPKAKDFNAWREYAKKIATNINFYYLDRDGNIGYNHGGLYPIRAADHDSRLPAKGDGSMDWSEYLNPAKNPNTYNPEQGYIQNWNNRPARGWRALDTWWKNWGRADRGNAIITELEAQDMLTAAQVWDINSRISFADINAPFLLPYLRDALAKANPTPETQAALDTLESWDQYWWDKDNDGYFDSAAPAIMETWIRQLLETALKDDIADQFFFRYASPGYPTGRIYGAVSASPGTKALVRILDQHAKGWITGYDFFNGEEPAQVLASTFETAITQLQSEQGTNQSAWRVKPHPLIFSANNFRGVRQTTEANELSLPIGMNRGTENNLFIARGTHIESYDVAPPGQSGFIAPDGTKTPHYDDQMQLYQDFKNKPLPFDREAVDGMTEETIRLSY